jgi:hypothetical protein
VFQPSGSSGANVHTTWESLYAAQAAVSGLKFVEFDDSFVSSDGIFIPGGAWPMDTVWIGRGPRPGKVRAIVNLPEGAEFPNQLKFAGWIFLKNRSVSTSPFTITASSQNNIVNIGDHVGGNPQFENLSTTRPMFFVSGSNPTVHLRGAVFGMPLASSSIVQVASAATLTLNSDDTTRVGSNWVNAISGSTIRIDMGSAFYGVTQTSLSGTLQDNNQRSPKWRVFPLPPTPSSTTPIALGTTAAQGQAGDIWRLNGSGTNLTQSLPSIRSSLASLGATMTTAGRLLMIKETSGAGSVLLVPSGSDTIEGSASGITVPATGSRIFASDGFSNWMIVGSYI